MLFYCTNTPGMYSLGILKPLSYSSLPPVCTFFYEYQDKLLSSSLYDQWCPFTSEETVNGESLFVAFSAGRPKVRFIYRTLGSQLLLVC